MPLTIVRVAPPLIILVKPLIRRYFHRSLRQMVRSILHHALLEHRVCLCLFHRFHLVIALDIYILHIRLRHLRPQSDCPQHSLYHEMAELPPLFLLLGHLEADDLLYSFPPLCLIYTPPWRHHPVIFRFRLSKLTPLQLG